MENMGKVRTGFNELHRRLLEYWGIRVGERLIEWRFSKLSGVGQEGSGGGKREAMVSGASREKGGHLLWDCCGVADGANA